MGQLRYFKQIYPLALPEYPHKPAAHLKSPTAIKIRGRTSHCEIEPRAGHRKAVNVYVGLCPGGLEREGRSDGAVDMSLPPFLTFRRGL